jgi:hypothetical protein
MSLLAGDCLTTDLIVESQLMSATDCRLSWWSRYIKSTWTSQKTLLPRIPFLLFFIRCVKMAHFLMKL